jgi:N-acetyltransferase
MTHPITLEGHFVTLQKLQPTHLKDLEKVAVNPAIWQYLPIEGWRNDVFWNWATNALDEQMRGLAHAFAIIDNKTGKTIGTSRFQDMDAHHNRTDIGWTWISAEFWGLGYNFEAKNLMFTHAFESWNVQRVGFKVDELNLRSQRALEKVGTSREGFFRNHMIRPDGSRRNSYFYGMTDEDWWDFAKDKLQNLVLDAIVTDRHATQYTELSHSIFLNTTFANRELVHR